MIKGFGCFGTRTNVLESENEVAMNILVIDAQGGGIGKQLVAAIREEVPGADITAVGTNSAAASAMKKAGADRAATGENAVVVNCRKADVIAGPIGIVIADALLGEITATMANAIATSLAKRILIPVSHCDNIVAGTVDLKISSLIKSAVDEIKKLID